MTYLPEIIVSLVVAIASAVGSMLFTTLRRNFRLWRFRRTFGADLRDVKDLVVSVPLWRAIEGPI